MISDIPDDDIKFLLYLDFDNKYINNSTNQGNRI